MGDLDWHSITDDDPWLRLGESFQSSSFMGDLDGKYLFFSTDQKLLMKIMEDEVANHGFSVAKVINEPRGEEYVACLYWHSPDRKHELADRYKNTPNLKYRYYKSNADTRARKYSPQFLASTPTTKSKSMKGKA